MLPKCRTVLSMRFRSTHSERIVRPSNILAQRSVTAHASPCSSHRCYCYKYKQRANNVDILGVVSVSRTHCPSSSPRRDFVDLFAAVHPPGRQAGHRSMGHHEAIVGDHPTAESDEGASPLDHLVVAGPVGRNHPDDGGKPVPIAAVETRVGVGRVWRRLLGGYVRRGRPDVPRIAGDYAAHPVAPATAG